jgi:hypothetical protein
MTRFEGFLIDKGYSMYVLNCKEMKYQKANSHIISTMVNLDHRYIHNTDVNLLDKINKGKSVMDEDFTWDDRKGEICFGLHEQDKPPTLISPRPRIRIQKTVTIDSVKKDIVITEQNDDAMNIVLKEIEYEEIFRAMYDNSICFEFDLRDVSQAEA